MDEDDKFGVNTKFVAQFLDISKGGEIHFQDSTRAMHLHILHYAPLPHVIDFGGDGTLHGCKVIAQAYVVKVIKSLWQQFLDLKLLNVAKLLSSNCFLANLTLFHQNARLWPQNFIEYFSTNG